MRKRGASIHRKNGVPERKGTHKLRYRPRRTLLCSDVARLHMLIDRQSLIWRAFSHANSQWRSGKARQKARANSRLPKRPRRYDLFAQKMYRTATRRTVFCSTLCKNGRGAERIRICKSNAMPDKHIPREALTCSAHLFAICNCNARLWPRLIFIVICYKFCGRGLVRPIRKESESRPSRVMNRRHYLMAIACATAAFSRRVILCRASKLARSICFASH